MFISLAVRIVWYSLEPPALWNECASDDRELFRQNWL